MRKTLLLKRPVSGVLLFFLVILSCLKANAQTTISGTVRDVQGNVLPGVSVAVKGSAAGQISDNSGKYMLQVPSGNATLLFSYVGYVPQEVKVNSRNQIDVTLLTDSKSLSEVVVVGYGVQNKRDVTGAVSTIKASDLNTTNAVSIDNLIQGKAAGVNVNTYTSQPGGDVSVTIRGSLSPNGSNAPLYVIDGLPITNMAYETVPTPGAFRGNVDRSPLAGINPDDIASVDILKDASATAIYGSAAANGVILITTKKGKANATTVDYSGTYSVQGLKKYELHRLCIEEWPY